MFLLNWKFSILGRKIPILAIKKNFWQKKQQNKLVKNLKKKKPIYDIKGPIFGTKSSIFDRKMTILGGKIAVFSTIIHSNFRSSTNTKL